MELIIVKATCRGCHAKQRVTVRLLGNSAASTPCRRCGMRDFDIRVRATGTVNVLETGKSLPEWSSTYYER